MQAKSLNCTLRLGAKDGDLLLLAEEYGIAELIFFSVRKYLGKHTGCFQLPPPKNVEERIYSVRLKESKDADVYRFLSSIPPGNRSQVIKLLIRHATEECDIRFLSGEYIVKKAMREYEHAGAPQTPPTQKPFKSPKSAAVQRDTVSPTTPKSSAPPASAAQQEQDEIFDFI